MRIGAVVFSSQVEIAFYLDDYDNKKDIIKAISAYKTKFMDGNTETGDAMETMRRNMFISSRGDRSDAPNIAVIITDGESTDSDKTLNEAARLHSNNVRVISVGITLGIKEKELKAISSAPHILNSDYYTVDTFNNLNKITDGITSSTCSGTNTIPCHGAKLDLVIASGMYLSSSENWNSIKLWARDIINRQVISISDTNVGLVSLKNRVSIESKLDKYTSRSELLDAVENIYSS